MTFALTSVFGFLVGTALLGLALWALQRLRVQHREVEVITTLFWESALKETRARVFVRRFRHWPAWLLLFGICTLLWMLLAQPQVSSLDARRHVVMVDWTAPAEQRSRALDRATETLKGLPATARELIAVNANLHTLLSSGEEVYLAQVRAKSLDDLSASSSIQWSLESLTSRANEDQPMSIYLVGNADIEQSYIDLLPDTVDVVRIPVDEPAAIPYSLKSLGFADAKSGRWNSVDVRFAINSESSVDPQLFQLSLGDQPVNGVQTTQANTFELLDLAAQGQTLTVSLDDQVLGQLTLPTRDPTKVLLEDGVPPVLKELVDLAPAFQIVQEQPDIRIGYSDTCDLRLSGQEGAAFEIVTNQEDPNAAMLDLVDELALTQIDATSLAQQSGQVIDVQVLAGEKRRIVIWNSLFTPAFDFTESRACPIFVSQAIQWLAQKPDEVPWAAQGETLPTSSPKFQIPTGDSIKTNDGRDIAVSPIPDTVEDSATIRTSDPAGWLGKVTPYTWLGILLSVLLVGEWVLYQKGRMP